MNYNLRTHLLAALLVLLISAPMWACVAILGPDLASAATPARSVSLSDARIAPSWVAVVKPGRFVTPPTNRKGQPCKGRKGRRAFFSDVSAYTGTGGALGPQYDTTSYGDPFIAWDSPRGGSVGYDGLTFYNATEAPVLVAGWCD